MDKKTDEILQNANQVDKAVTTNKAKMVENGFDEQMQQQLKDARQDLVNKASGQDKAVARVSELTTLQDTTVESKRLLCKQVKTAAKSAYGKDPEQLKLFRVGEDVPKSSKRVCSLCDVQYKLVDERKAVFLKNGFTQVMIDGLGSGRADIEAVDTEQENAKKAQKAATILRNQAYKVLDNIIFKIRNFAKTCFAGKPEILVEFEPIAGGRGGSEGGVDNPPAPPAQ